MYVKVLALSAAFLAGNVAAQMPECTVGSNDYSECTTPMGGPGYFICPAVVQMQETTNNLRQNIPPIIGEMLGQMDENRPSLPGLSKAICMPTDLPPEIQTLLNGPFGGVCPK